MSRAMEISADRQPPPVPPRPATRPSIPTAASLHRPSPFGVHTPHRLSTSPPQHQKQDSEAEWPEDVEAHAKPPYLSTISYAFWAILLVTLGVLAAMIGLAIRGVIEQSDCHQDFTLPGGGQRQYDDCRDVAWRKIAGAIALACVFVVLLFTSCCAFMDVLCFRTCKRRENLAQKRRYLHAKRQQKESKRELKRAASLHSQQANVSVALVSPPANERTELRARSPQARHGGSASVPLVALSVPTSTASTRAPSPENSRILAQQQVHPTLEAPLTGTATFAPALSPGPRAIVTSYPVTGSTRLSPSSPVESSAPLAPTPHLVFHPPNPAAA